MFNSLFDTIRRAGQKNVAVLYVPVFVVLVLDLFVLLRLATSILAHLLFQTGLAANFRNEITLGLMVFVVAAVYVFVVEKSLSGNTQ